ADDAAVVLDDPEVAEVAERVLLEIPAPRLDPARIRERARVHLEDALEVGGAGRADDHGARVPQTSPQTPGHARAQISMSEAKKRVEGGQHLGGARADFVASLGRKVEAARELLAGVEARPTDPEPRDELRRRMHALCSGAKLLRFDVMVRTLTEADQIFTRV